MSPPQGEKHVPTVTIENASDIRKNKRRKEGPWESMAPLPPEIDISTLARADAPTPQQSPMNLDVFTAPVPPNTPLPLLPNIDNNRSPQLPPSPSPVTQSSPQELSPQPPSCTENEGQPVPVIATPPTTAATSFPQLLPGMSQPQGDQKNHKSMIEQVMGAEERGETTPALNSIIRDPLKGYTDVAMPKVHLAFPTAALNEIECAVIKCWDEFLKGKLLAQPFSMAAFNQANHASISALIFGAIIEITKAENIMLSIPQPQKDSNKTPIPSSSMTSQLTRNRHFFRGEYGPHKCLDYLFTIKGLTTTKANEVQAAVEEVWHDADTTAFITSICNRVVDVNKIQAKQTLDNFIESMWITVLDTKMKGNMPALS
ncbi:hypothetical protein BJV74DRAFT_792604 [Russula compacta]|nr:hypothetical protein BJV74DRAFT_792604 [Russula compacta]